MKALRLMFPPLIVWILAGGLVSALLSHRGAPEMEADLVVGFDPQPISKESERAFSVLPNAKFYEDQLRSAAERPLFSETRRLPEPEPVEIPQEIVEPQYGPKDEITITEPPVPPVAPALVLKGFVRYGEDMQALLGLMEASEEQWVSIGDVILGWRVQEISESFVRLEKDGFEHIAEISQ